MTEQWKVVAICPDYAVSDLGRVKRLTSRTRGKAGNILKTALRNGYPAVDLCRNGKRKFVCVHALVMVAFHPDRPSSKHVPNHKDGNRTNNRSSNLEWVTQSENIKHAYRLGLRDARGEGNGQSRLTDRDVLELRQEARDLYRGFYAAAARRFNVSPSTIHDAVYGRTWGHLPGALA